MKNEFGQVIPISAWRKGGGYVASASQVAAEQTVKALVYPEDGEYIVAFGQPPYLWRRHSSLEEVEQTYFYFDWSVPQEEQDIGNAPILVGKL
ncbi:hypothetical protein [Sporomusa sp.]|uniref:hypothetical protein n=1 Tax=Sporomusa sp. TaxID=2078658 RepID=UPI002C24DB3C|nr:hypothetical protein [Sporomusa sp.]HWR42847.1 hypothetical protein [Sporomusa sp.]